MGNALCPLSVAPRTLSVAPTDSAHAHHTPSVWLVSRKKRATLLPAARPALLLSAFCALRAALTLRSQLCFALSAPLCALSAALSISYQPLALALSSDDDPPLSALLSAFALCHHLHRPRSTPRFRQALRAAYTRAVTPVELGFGLAVMHLRCACSFSSAARPRSQQ